MTLFYREKGEGNRTIIIVHGLYGASDNWLSVAGDLEEDFRVILIDQRNHGQSPHSNNHTYKTMTQDLLELMQQKKIEKAILIGHSMGGKTVMRFSLEHPEMVEKMIVVDIAPKPYEPSSNYAQITADHKKILDALSSLDLSQFESRSQIDSALKETFPTKKIRMFLMKNLKRNNEGHFSWQLNLYALKNNMEEIMDGFSDLKEPTNDDSTETIFIKGEHSPYIQDEDNMVIQKFFPGSQIITIPKAGHWLHAEQHDLFVKTIRYFLET
jgi:esterase